MSCSQCSLPTSCLTGGSCVATHMPHAYCQPSLRSSWAASRSLQEQALMRGRECAGPGRCISCFSLPEPCVSAGGLAQIFYELNCHVYSSTMLLSAGCV